MGFSKHGTALAILLVCAAPTARAQTISYVAKTLAGSEIRVGAGQPATLVAVWATWCSGCRREFRTLESLTSVLAPKGIRVLALSVDDASDSVVSRYVTARKSKLLVAHDGSGAVSRTFGVTGVPESILIDKAGVIRWRGRGELDENDRGLRAALLALH